MAEDGLRGLSGTINLFDRLPQAAREELGVELVLLGREGLAAQRAATPDDTGQLKAGLSLQAVLADLKVRIGLIGQAAKSRGALRRAAKVKGATPQNFGDLFYGRIVYFGRKAQTVLVQRRRRVGGVLRTQNRRKRAEDIVKTYSMKVQARSGVPYIDAPGRDFDQTAAGQLAEYWSRTLNRAGSAP
jgi:hypothetical protein